MLSRVADSLYWLGRYTERTETNAHILALQLEHMLERSVEDHTSNEEWRIVLSICGYIEDYDDRYTGYDIQTIKNYLLFDVNNYNAIWQLIHNIRENARNARDIIPTDLWVAWNELYLGNQQNKLKIAENTMEVASFLDTVRKTTLISTGIVDSLMMRDECFMFVKIGKWIERAEKTALIVSHLLEQEDDLYREFRSNFALQLTNANEEFTRKFRMRNPDDVINFLMGDLKCARSVAYGIRKIKATLQDLEGGTIHPFSKKMFETVTKLENIVKIDVKLLTVIERKKWVNDIREMCTNFGPIFSQTYFLTKPILVK